MASADRTATTSKRPRRNDESREQRLFVQLWRLHPDTRDLPACAIPNGGHRSRIGGSILKAEGVSAGAPDWMCFAPTQTGRVGLAIEFKSPTGTPRISPAQTLWHSKLRAAGWAVAVATSAQFAWDLARLHYNVRDR